MQKGGLLVWSRQKGWKPALPSILLANVQSLANKTNKLNCCIISLLQGIIECCTMIVMEMWLTYIITDEVMQPQGFSLFRTDRTAECMGRNKGGGVCCLVNNSWCMDVHVLSQHCSPSLELLAIKRCPFYPPREISTILMEAVYIQPWANANIALSKLYSEISKLQNQHPEAVPHHWGWLQPR